MWSSGTADMIKDAGASSRYRSRCGLWDWRVGGHQHSLDQHLKSLPQSCEAQKPGLHQQAPVRILNRKSVECWRLSRAQAAVRPFFPRVVVLNLPWFSLHRKVEGREPNIECAYILGWFWWRPLFLFLLNGVSLLNVGKWHVWKCLKGPPKWTGPKCVQKGFYFPLLSFLEKLLIKHNFICTVDARKVSVCDLQSQQGTEYEGLEDAEP